MELPDRPAAGRRPNKPILQGSREDHDADVARVLTPEQRALRRRRQQRLAKLRRSKRR